MKYHVGVRFVPVVLLAACIGFLSWADPMRKPDTTAPAAAAEVARTDRVVCLAGALRAPLVVTRGEEGEADEIKRQLKEWETREIYAIGEAPKLDGSDARRVPLADEEAVVKAYLQQQVKKGIIPTLVVANPS